MLLIIIIGYTLLLSVYALLIINDPVYISVGVGYAIVISVGVVDLLLLVILALYYIYPYINLLVACYTSAILDHVHYTDPPAKNCENSSYGSAIYSRLRHYVYAFA